MKMMNQDEVLEAINTLKIECSLLRSQAAERGLTVAAPTLSTEDIVAAHDALAAHKADLLAQLQVKPSPASPSPAAAPAIETPLTADELAQLNWTQKCQLAGGFWTVAQCRASIKAKADKNAQKKLTGTEKILAARGVKSLKELREKCAANPNPNLD